MSWKRIKLLHVCCQGFKVITSRLQNQLLKAFSKTCKLAYQYNFVNPLLPPNMLTKYSSHLDLACGTWLLNAKYFFTLLNNDGAYLFQNGWMDWAPSRHQEFPKNLNLLIGERNVKVQASFFSLRVSSRA